MAAEADDDPFATRRIGESDIPGQTDKPDAAREETLTEEDDSEEEPQDRGILTYLGLTNLLPDIMSIQMCARERQKDTPGLPPPPPTSSEPGEREVGKEGKSGKIDDRKLLELQPRGARLVTVEDTAASTAATRDLTSGANSPWQWPSWALNASEPCIEVFVEDKGTGRWSRAVPVDRVLDRAGNDELLTAHYEWDDEVYEQDFGPEHVRRLGSIETLQDMIASGKLDNQQSTQMSTFNSQAVKAQMASFASNASSTMQVLKEHLLHMSGGPITPQYRNKGVGYRPPLPAQGIGERGNLNADTAPDSTFRWPDYALEYDAVTIEVYVEEAMEDGKKIGRWVAAMPKNRVVGPQGEDVFLSAEYDLHGSSYVQEFEPFHVRRLGSSEPVQPPD